MQENKDTITEIPNDKSNLKWVILMLGSICGLAYYMIFDIPGILSL